MVANFASVNLSGDGGNLKKPGGRVQVMLAGIELPVAQFSMTYELNSIPTATVLVALGRNTETNKPSSIYDLVPKLKTMVDEITVKLVGELGDWSTAAGEDSKQVQFPNPPGGGVLFIGYVSGLSYRRSSGQISTVLSLTNKLVDLTMASGGSVDAVPGSPVDYFIPLFTAGPGIQNPSVATTIALKYALSLPPKLLKDFSAGIAGVLYDIASNNHLQYGKIWCGGIGKIDALKQNTLAMSVIKGTLAADGWQGISTITSPLLVQGGGAAPAASKMIGERIAGSLAATSLWGTLIQGILPEFGCGVVPTAQTAIITPILSSAYNATMTIGSEDYADFDMTTMSQRPLRGVGVTGLASMLSTVKNSGVKLCVGASYSIDGPGMWMFVPAPGWINHWISWDSDAAKKSSVNYLLSQPSSTAVSAQPATAAAIVAKTAAEATIRITDINGAMHNYAKLIYSLNALRGREGTLTGKLRFDISPGTTIRIKASSKGTTGVDKLATDLIAFVVGVVVNINAEAASAATTFRLTNIRTEEENNDKTGRFSMTKHPYFGDAYFKGEPLVSALTPFLVLPPADYLLPTVPVSPG